MAAILTVRDSDDEGARRIRCNYFKTLEIFAQFKELSVCEEKLKAISRTSAFGPTPAQTDPSTREGRKAGNRRELASYGMSYAANWLTG
jgi:hypothetical protein